MTWLERPGRNLMRSFGTVRQAFPGVAVQALENAIGEPHRAQSVVAADPRAAVPTRGLNEIFQLQGQRFTALGLNPLDLKERAEDALLDLRGVGHVEPAEVKL